nr:replication initiation protein [Microvirus sp.]
MKCLHPINLKRGGQVPCGKCVACQSNLQESWAFRLEEEATQASFIFWLTLTYRDEDISTIDGERVLNKAHIQHFCDNIKHYIRPYKFKYFCGAEYSPVEYRPHYHVLLFFYAPLSEQDRYWRYICEDIGSGNSRAWRYGMVRYKRVHFNAYRYCCKYVNKFDMQTLGGYVPPVLPFRMMSKGLGKSYLDKVAAVVAQNQNFIVKQNGKRKVLPRYYRSALGLGCDSRAVERGLIFEEERLRRRSILDDKLLREAYQRDYTIEHDYRGDAGAYYRHLRAIEENRKDIVKRYNLKRKN